jgi:protein SCO1/2
MYFCFCRTLLVFWGLSTWALAAPLAAPLPNSPLVNQDGKPFQLYDLKGRFVFVSFIYSRCPMPKMCPLTVQLSNQLVEAWKKQKEKPELQVLAVTLDPAFDKPAILKKFALARGVDLQHFTFATGTLQTLSDLASQFNVIGIPSEGGLVSHNMKSILLSPSLVELKEYRDNEWNPEMVLKDMKEYSKLKPHG